MEASREAFAQAFQVTALISAAVALAAAVLAAIMLREVGTPRALNVVADRTGGPGLRTWGPFIGLHVPLLQLCLPLRPNLVPYETFSQRDRCEQGDLTQ